MTQGSNWDSHNHGPSEGRGLDCGEKPIGWCIRDAKDAELAELRAEVERLTLRGGYELSEMQYRAEAAEARVARVEALCRNVDGPWKNSYATVQVVSLIAALSDKGATR